MPDYLHLLPEVRHFYIQHKNNHQLKYKERIVSSLFPQGDACKNWNLLPKEIRKIKITSLRTFKCVLTGSGPLFGEGGMFRLYIKLHYRRAT